MCDCFIHLTVRSVHKQHCKHIRSAACIDLTHAPKSTEAHGNLCMSLQELFTSTCGIKTNLTLHKTYRISLHGVRSEMIK